MPTVRLLFLLGILVIAGCSPDPSPRTRVTGNDTAVAGWPRQPTGDRFLIDKCCTLRLATGTQSTQGQGVDSVVHDLSGPGYVLRIVFGPYDGGEPLAGYRLEQKRIVDSVELNAFRWADRIHGPPEGQLLWIASVGGGVIHGVEHAPWHLRLMLDCTSSVACARGASLVKTIRF